jgi:hypothetical protein
VARRGVSVHTEQSCTEQSYIEPEKAVSVWHKHELIVTQDTETIAQTQRTGQKIVKQLNKAGMSEQIVTARRLLSSNIVLTTDKEAICTKCNSSVNIEEHRPELGETQWIDSL